MSKSVDFTFEEAQLIVQVLERSPAGNKTTVMLKQSVLNKVIPFLPDDGEPGNRFSKAV